MSLFDGNFKELTPDPADRYHCTICADEVRVGGMWYDGDHDEIPDDYGLLMCCDCELWATLVEIGNAWR